MSTIESVDGRAAVGPNAREFFGILRHLHLIIMYIIPFSES